MLARYHKVLKKKKHENECENLGVSKVKPIIKNQYYKIR